MSANSRLSMLDENGGRRFIIPAEVKGRLRKWRTRVLFVLFIIFLGLPWVQIDGTQAVLLDISKRRFIMFGQVFLSHDAPLVFFIFAIFALLLMLVTALWGRVWCGWACPQTVFIDAVFRRIEILVEGNYLERRRRHNAPLSFEKILRHGIKWLLFLVVSSLFAHSFTAYFTGSRELIRMMTESPNENWSYFLTVSAVTGLILFNFGWFREQFCIIMCPYGRFQSVLMDRRSVTVAYDEKRGEPRRGLAGDSRGDCVSCNRCVQVCPTGIDIRNGLQMECIGCTACIDACNEIMVKLKKPEGLISYRGGRNTLRSFFRPRIIVYLALLFVCGTSLGLSLFARQSFSIALLRATDSPYQVAPSGSIINHLKANLHNQSHARQEFRFTLVHESKETLLTQAGANYELEPGKSREVHLFVSASKRIFEADGKAALQIQVHEKYSSEVRVLDAVLIGPVGVE